MSLITTSLMEVVKKQYFFKLKANIDSFSSLVGIQLIALFFSLGGSGGMGSGSEWLSIDVKFYSSDLVIAFTMIWGLVTGITITTKPFRDHDFTFVTNRLSSSLSNIFFLMTGSIIGAVTAMLASYLLRFAGYFIFGEQLYSSSVGAGEFLLGIFVAFLYIFCVSSVGYFIGTLVQVNKIFVGLVPALVLGSVFLDATLQREPSLGHLFRFYFMESSVILFMVKILITIALFFAGSISILNQMGVRR